MNVFESGAVALALAAIVTGCTPMPKIEPVEKTAAALSGIGDPFQFKLDRESIDVADQVTDARALPLDLAVRLTLVHDPRLQAALARVRQSQAEAEQTRLLPNPILALAVRFPTGGGGKPDIDASVAADLLSLLLRPGRISAADQRLRKSTSEALVVVLDVLAEVQQQYSKVQALDARVKIDEARYGILNELLRVTEARMKGGEAARLDVLTVQSELASLETELLSRRSEERQARFALARLVGQPSAPAVWTLDAWSEPATVSGDESKWLKAALERRPELQSVVWELAGLGQEMRVARFASVAQGGELGADAERSEGEWSIGPSAVIGLPIFDFGQAQRALISARIIEQRHQLTGIERQVIQEVRIALEQLRSAKAGLDQVKRRLIPLQNERLNQANNSYRLGLADVLAVRLAEQDLQQALSQQVDLQEQVSQASFQLTRAAGGIPPAELASTSTRQSATKESEQQTP